MPSSEDITLVGDPSERSGGADDSRRRTGSDGGREREIPRGSTLGRYVVLERIGAGAMGVVYAAYDPELDRRVAIKLVHAPTSEVSGSSEGSGRLIREAQAMARLSHPNVIVVHDVGTLDDQVFIAMEYVDGGTITAWLAESPRDWELVLEKFRKAGAGLAAAHAAGIVHRDFKPDNVLLGQDGRVRVVDFGLARPTEMGSSMDQTAPDDLIIDSGTGSLDVRLTRTGALVGTPAYMAPEQHEGNVVSARSDQFSFCVALYEALYGQRPFAGENLAALAFQVMRGKVQPPPTGTPVPRWVHQELLRGLQVEVENRHASMDALLAALTPKPERRGRGLLAVGALGVALAGGAASLALAQPDEQTQCVAGQERLEAIWNDGVREEARRAFSATGKPFAEASWTRADAVLDAYAANWVASYMDACLATRVRGEQSELLLDRRMACLERRLTELSTVAELVRSADEQVVARSIDVTGGLSALAPCSDTEALLAAVDPPPPDLEDPVRRARALLDEVKVLREAGRYETARARLDALAEVGDALDYGPIAAERAYFEGALAWDLGRFPEAEAQLQDAAVAAARLHMDALATDAWTSLLSVVALSQRKYDEGDRIALAAEAAIARLGDPPQKRARLLASRGTIAYLRERNDEAEAFLKEALELREAHLGAEHDETLHTLDLLALVHHARGEYDRAQATFEREIEARERSLGGLHPSLVNPLANLARVHNARSETKQAQVLYERALTVMEGAQGPDHAGVATIRHNLANSLRGQGKLDEAKAHLDRALEIEIAVYGEDSEMVAGDYNGLGMLELARGDNEAAIQQFEQALTRWEKALGSEHHKLAYALTGQGRALVALDRHAEAIEALERALAIRDASEHAEAGRVPGSETARTCSTLAEALWATGDRTRAVAMAERAGELLADVEGAEERRAEVESWLSQHG